MENKNLETFINKLAFYHEYSSDDKIIVSLIVNNKNIKAVNPILTHNFDHDDMLLFLFTLNFCKPDFIKTQRIRVYFNDVAKFINKPVDNSLYNFIEERFDKLYNKQFEISYYEEEKNITHIINLLQYMKFNINEKYIDRSYVDMQISDFIMQQLIDIQTKNMYKKQIISFTNPISKLMMFTLQRDRIECYKYNEEYRKVYYYNYFSSRIGFPLENSKEENIRLLIDAFEEIKKQNIIVDTVEYYSDKEVFVVRFIPFSETEIEDLISDRNFEIK
mgnify:FL=1